MSFLKIIWSSSNDLFFIFSYLCGLLSRILYLIIINKKNLNVLLDSAMHASCGALGAYALGVQACLRDYRLGVLAWLRLVCLTNSSVWLRDWTLYVLVWLHVLCPYVVIYFTCLFCSKFCTWCHYLSINPIKPGNGGGGGGAFLPLTNLNLSYFRTICYMNLTFANFY